MDSDMQVLQAGDQKLLLLELDGSILEGIANQAGFTVRSNSESPRMITLELSASRRQLPLLLFDASDPGNAGWFSRCQFYVDGKTGNVMQTPLRVGNLRDRAGRLQTNGVRIQLDKELPVRFRMPGQQLVNEQTIYAIFYNLLNALTEVGVALCGGGTVTPLSGRGNDARSRT
jgi:hypothetical protein